MEQLYLCLASTALFTSILVSFWSFTAWGQLGRTFQEFFLSYHRKGLLSVLFPTAFLYHFRTRAELDMYLEASQIRERAIERINDVTGTYGLFSSFCLHFFKPCGFHVCAILMIAKLMLCYGCGLITE